MENLENILEITTAILRQKNNRNSTIANIVESLFRRENNFPDLSSEEENKKENTMNSQHKISKNLFKKVEKPSYSPFKAFSEYISNVKDKLYSYYSKIKDTFKDIVGKIGYTDKLLMEFEDWGVVYFKTTFKRLVRLTPMGITQRYLEKLWIYLSKKIK